MKLFSRQLKSKTFVILLVISGVILLWSLKQFDLYESNDISCHSHSTIDDLPSAGGLNFKEKSIFFIETSCRGGVDARQACAIETAARVHPGWSIIVLFAGPVPHIARKERNFAKLLQFSNIKFLRLHIAEYAKETPLDNMLSENIFDRSLWRVRHSADVLRYLILYKSGGIYLDLDVLVVRSFDNLPRNWAAKENKVAIGAGALAFSRDKVGRKVADAAVREIKKSYNPKLFADSSVGVLKRVLQKTCNTSVVAEMSAGSCQGFEVVNTEYFYPIDWSNWRRYFQPGELRLGNSYGFHVWNFHSHHTKVLKESRYGKLAKKFCPSIYEINGGNF